MGKRSAAGLLTSVDSIFTTQEERDNAQRSYVTDLSAAEISDFPNHPFKVRMDQSMVELADSVKQYGVLVPSLVRPMPDGSYQMVSGHRRKRAAELAGLPTVPCIIRELTDDEAIIVMVDSNLQREQILPSEKAFAYNPFAYLRSDNDIQRLVTNLFKNTTPKGAQSQDPFWDQAAQMLLLALVFYLHYEAPPEERNFSMVMEMIRAGEVREDDDTYQSPLDELFDRLEMRDPEHIALKYYRNYRSGSGKTLKSIQITLVSRLEKFNLESLAGMTQTDEMELWSLGEKKTAIFAVIPDNDSSFNFIVGLLYTQLFQQLYYQADVVHGGRLPVHVHFVMDEFANVALPDEFDKLLATMRSREISVSIIIQNLAQLKALFEKQWESLVGNCDEFLYMGGNEQSTHEYVSKLLGKETIDTNTYGQSKGRSGSYSTNWQLTGRELLMPDEVRMLDNQYALLFIRGERPVRDLKYDILKHPNIKLTTDGGAEPYRHGEDVHSIVSIRFDKELLKQAAEKDGQDAPKHRFILLTEEELEQKFIELEEQENAEQQKGK